MPLRRGRDSAHALAASINGNGYPPTIAWRLNQTQPFKALQFVGEVHGHPRRCDAGQKNQRL